MGENQSALQRSRERTLLAKGVSLLHGVPLSCGAVVSEHFQATQGVCFSTVLRTGDEFFMYVSLVVLSDP